MEGVAERVELPEEHALRRRGLEVWAVEQIGTARFQGSPPPPVLPSDGDGDAADGEGSGSEASTASQGTAEGFSGWGSRRSSLSDEHGSLRSSLSGESDEHEGSSRRSSVSSVSSDASGGYASDASSGGYASDASSGGYTSDASGGSGGYASDGYASSDGEHPSAAGGARAASRAVMCRAHPLHHAAATSDVASVVLLLQDGEDPNGLDKHGCTPLHRAAHSGTLEIVVQILGARADVSATTGHGHTALHRACMRGQVEAVSELLRAGADHTVTARRGYTALHYAARAGYASSARLLLEARADPDPRDFLPDSRNTPMHKACQHGRGEAVYTLLGYNGRPTLLNAARRTPLQVAEDHGEEEAVAVIEAFAHSALLLARSQLLAFAGLLHPRLGTRTQALPIHGVLNADLAQAIGLAYTELQRVHEPVDADLLPPQLEREEAITEIPMPLPAMLAPPESEPELEPEAGVIDLDDDERLVAARPRVVHAHLEAVRAEIRLAKQQRQQARRDRRAAQAAAKAGGGGGSGASGKDQPQRRSSFGRDFRDLEGSQSQLTGGGGSGDSRGELEASGDSSQKERVQSSSPRGHGR